MNRPGVGDPIPPPPSHRLPDTDGRQHRLRIIVGVIVTMVALAWGYDFFVERGIDTRTEHAVEELHLVLGAIDPDTVATASVTGGGDAFPAEVGAAQFRAATLSPPIQVRYQVDYHGDSRCILAELSVEDVVIDVRDGSC